MNDVNKPGLVVDRKDMNAQTLITRHYFYLTAGERSLVADHTYTVVCSICKNKRIDKTGCYGCNGTGKTRAIGVTEKLQSLIDKLMLLEEEAV